MDIKSKNKIGHAESETLPQNLRNISKSYFPNNSSKLAHPEYAHVIMFDSCFLYLINHRFCGNGHLCIFVSFETEK